MDFITKTGAEVKLAMADFEDVLFFKSVIQTVIAEKGLDIDLDISKITSSDGKGKVTEMLPQLMKAVILIEGDKRFHESFMRCLKRCTYNSKKIDKNLWNDTPEAREDYYELVLEVLKLNFSPLLKPLLSLFTEIIPEQKPSGQKQT